MKTSHPPEEELSALVDGELTARRRRQVSAHVMYCSRCSSLCGQLLATRRAVEQPEVEGNAPAGLWERIRSALDKVDTLSDAVHRTQPTVRHTRLPVLVGAGLFLIVAALLINLTISTPLTGVQLLARAHDANSNLPFYSPTEGYHAVGTGDDAQSWRLVRHVWIRLGKDFVEQTVYQVGYCPVSEFTGLPDAFFPTRMIQANRWGYTFYLAVDDTNCCVVAWRNGTQWKALVARTTPRHLLQLAAIRAAAVPVD